jgi:hypothetical protein
MSGLPVIAIEYASTRNEGLTTFVRQIKVVPRSIITLVLYLGREFFIVKEE